eukprot:s384_g20.t1
MVQKFQPNENLANAVENRENRHADSNVCDPLLELKDNVSLGARDFDQDLNRYSPRDRVVCAAIILWFMVPIFWSWRFSVDRGVLLSLSTASTVFLTLAAFNFYLDGTRYTWKMLEYGAPMVSKAMIFQSSNFHSQCHGYALLDVAAVAILATFQLLRVFQAPAQMLMALGFTLAFVGFWVLNGLQITWAQGLAKVGLDWILSFLSYRWCAVLACISVAISETEMQSAGLTPGPTLSHAQMGCLTAVYYSHSMLMWYRANSLKRDSDSVHNWLTWPRQLYWLVETAVVVALTCVCLGFVAGDQQTAHSLTQLATGGFFWEHQWPLEEEFARLTVLAVFWAVLIALNGTLCALPDGAAAVTPSSSSSALEFLRRLPRVRAAWSLWLATVLMTMATTSHWDAEDDTKHVIFENV